LNCHRMFTVDVRSSAELSRFPAKDGSFSTPREGMAIDDTRLRSMVTRSGAQ
jgi:hypothetical protein